MFFLSHLKWSLKAALSVAVFTILSDCSTRPAPKETLYKFFAAMRDEDSTAVKKTLAFDRVATFSQLTAVGIDSIPVTPEERAIRLVQEFTSGKINKLWLENRIVVGETEKYGDSAVVEISFIHLKTSKQYYNKMALIFRDGRWLICCFKML